MTDAVLPNESRPEMNDPLAGSLCHELRRTSVAVLAAMAAEFGRHDLKPSEANLLAYIGANPGCTQSDIARGLRSKAANLVPLIARLERDGLLDRGKGGGGRAIALSMSKKGAITLDKVQAGFTRLEDWLGADLAPDVRQSLIGALRNICMAACHYQRDGMEAAGHGPD